MDPRLLAAYNQELLYFKELAAEFADEHPKIARRLGMQAGEIGDPYVERLIQSASFAAARMQIKIDARFPEFSERFLETVYPNFMAPTPSMSVARLLPAAKEGDLTGGFVVERGTRFAGEVPDGEQTPCVFTSSQDVTLYPLEIVDAKLTGIPPDIPMLHRWVPFDRQVKGALRLRIRTTNQRNMAELGGLDRLSVYLPGDESIASKLYELIHAAGVATITGEPGEFSTPGASFHAVREGAIVHEGLEPGQGLLPLTSPRFHGHNLLHEFFTCPARFYFFTLTNLKKGLASVRGREAEIVVLFDQTAGELANHVSARCFSLFCTPVINLFPHTADSIELTSGNTEVLLRPVPLHPMDYEVFSIDRFYAKVDEDAERQEFMPRDAMLPRDEGGHGRYYRIRREQFVRSNTVRRYGTLTPHSSTECYVSLVDEDDRPYPEHMSCASAHVWLTNGDLPILFDRNGGRGLKPDISMPIEGAALVYPPSPPRPPLAHRDVAWDLIRQLSFDCEALMGAHADDSARSLREALGLFVPPDNTRQQRQINNLVGVNVSAITRNLPGNGPLRFGRGLAVELTVDERGFDGVSPYLFGLILDHYLARCVSGHSFIQTSLVSVQRGAVMRWPVRMGMRGVA
ncbi:type VI secretion system baseplate subunit TssF [Burkholderia contaminans]|nr:type VI secretion system baseplate subunit TssF [Burkholderia contaminans]